MTESKARSELRNVRKEFERAEKEVALWIIIKPYECGKYGRVVGKILARYGGAADGWDEETSDSSVVSVLFYATDDAPAIGATETMTGCGYDRTAEGVATLLWRLKEELAKWHGINFECPEIAMMRHWEQKLERNGYPVIRVL